MVHCRVVLLTTLDRCFWRYMPDLAKYQKGECSDVDQHGIRKLLIIISVQFLISIIVLVSEISVQFLISIIVLVSEISVQFLISIIVLVSEIYV